MAKRTITSARLDHTFKFKLDRLKLDFKTRIVSSMTGEEEEKVNISDQNVIEGMYDTIIAHNLQDEVCDKYLKYNEYR